MSMEIADLETFWERLAEAGPERETLLLAKLALLFGNTLGDRARAEDLIATALRDLPPASSRGCDPPYGVISFNTR